MPFLTRSDVCDLGSNPRLSRILITSRLESGFRRAVCGNELAIGRSAPSAFAQVPLLPLGRMALQPPTRKIAVVRKKRMAARLLKCSSHVILRLAAL